MNKIIPIEREINIKNIHNNNNNNNNNNTNNNNTDECPCVGKKI